MLCGGHMLRIILMEKNLFEDSTKKNWKKEIKNDLELKK